MAFLFVLVLAVFLPAIILKKSTTGQEDNKNVTAGSSVQTILDLLRSDNVPFSSSKEESDPYLAIKWMSKNIALPNELAPKTLIQYYVLVLGDVVVLFIGWYRLGSKL